MVSSSFDPFDEPWPPPRHRARWGSPAILPLLRVKVDDKDELHAVPARDLAPWERSSEAWWQEVLNDPRARGPRQKRLEPTGRHARFRLDRQQGPFLDLHCARCPGQMRMGLADAIRRYGEDYNVLALAQMLVTCNRGR
jgi:hypothetical protein